MIHQKKSLPRSPRSAWNESGKQKNQKGVNIEENLLEEIRPYQNQSDIELLNLKEKIELGLKKKNLKYEERISENWFNYLNFLLNDEVHSQMIENRNKIWQIVESSSIQLYQSLQEFEKRLEKAEVPELHQSIMLKETADLKYSQVQYQSTLTLESSLEQTIKTQIHSKILQLKSEISDRVALSFPEFFSSISSEVLQKIMHPSYYAFHDATPAKEPIPVKYNSRSIPQKSDSKIPQVSAGTLLQGFLI